MWMNIDKSRKDSAHYAVMRPIDGEGGMAALRGMFPSAEANELNFVLFSTSGVHGTSITIEEAEQYILSEEKLSVTFLIVHPRLVSLRYGTCTPQNQDDINYLKALRASSKEVLRMIGETR